MELYWVSPQHKMALICRYFAKKHGFLLPDDTIYVVVIKKNGDIVGLSALSSDPTDPYLLYIYVTKENRGQGVGDWMITEIIGSSANAGLTSLRCSTDTDNEINPFLAKYGFELFPGPKVYRVTLDSLRYSKQYLKKIDGKSSGKACALSSLGKADKDIVKSFLTRRGLPFNSGYNINISTVEISNGNVDALILCDRIPHGIVFKYLYIGKDKSPALLRCFRALNELKATAKDIPPGFTLAFALEGEKNYQLIRNLVGNSAQISEAVTTTLAVKLLQSDQ